MSRFDRYVLSQLVVLFGFFALVLVSIYWINQAVRLFDRLIGDGQSAFVFLEFTVLTLANVIRMVLPVAVFAATVYVTNRLSNESELVVMQATGFSPWRLARPVLIFGVGTALMLSALTHYLVPSSMAQLQWREAEVARNVTARLLTEGTFLHPTEGVTFYIREIDPDGTLRDVFLSDRRTPDRAVTYTAARAYLVNDEGGSRMVMLDGLAQNFILSENRLSTTHFVDYNFDISAAIEKTVAPRLRVRDVPTARFLADFEGVIAENRFKRGQAVEELHSRVAQSLLCVVAALIGFSSLLVGGFSRFGVWRQIMGALVLLVIVKFIEGLVTDPVQRDPALWPLMYLPILFGIGVAVATLWYVGRPRRPSRPVAEAGA
ncbi:lipopolysaccharide export system permease protein [Lutimaribacter pacificus]|uniref:Lipopolysaccharide export system permease protein n=1 Tax=Lutimaribacter pacificus TaxID=391948 RepID=A0A1H0A5M7_9RHOB|nr:LPS export ABC transporter permease LptF [Lutimaribacter pacificus]SDN28878.1 lipopolysaccharide export system permease protein [Lutimaribacter pacificus]SHJ72932.1 lipopolysaccharide export system permease protein [Lutimaribacter pacificus]